MFINSKNNFFYLILKLIKFFSSVSKSIKKIKVTFFTLNYLLKEIHFIQLVSLFKINCEVKKIIRTKRIKKIKKIKVNSNKIIV
jgi:hypothetical protein